MGGDQDTAKHPAIHRTSPTPTQKHLAQDVNSANDEKPRDKGELPRTEQVVAINEPFSLEEKCLMVFYLRGNMSHSLISFSLNKSTIFIYT